MIRALVTSIIVMLFAAGASGEAIKTKLQLNWKPEPQFGGFYAANVSGAFAKHGLEVEIVPAGSGTPTVQMLGAGGVDFAIISGDELITARARGNKVVALFAVYQTNPQAIMTRKARGFKVIGDIFKNPGTLAMQRGLPYATFLERKYGFGKIRIVPSPFGDLSMYRADANYSMQCFITSEPLAAKKTGVEPQTFLIADAGWNPYTTVLATRDEYLRDHPDVVKKMTDAVREGWRTYLDDPAATNDAMHKLNPTMELETFSASADAQKALIETEETKTGSLGVMVEPRWKTLIDQMTTLGLVSRDRAPAAKDCFTVAEPEKK